MKMTEGEFQFGSYTHKSAKHGQSTATLSNFRLHIVRGRSEAHYPLRAITAVSMSFQRRRGDIIGGAILLAFVLLFMVGLSWVQGNMSGLVSSIVGLAADFKYSAAQQAAMQQDMTQRAQTLVTIFPLFWVLASLSLLYAAWLLYAGIRGETRLGIRTFDDKHDFVVRGNNAALLEFGESVAQRLR